MAVGRYSAVANCINSQSSENYHEIGFFVFRSFVQKSPSKLHQNVAMRSER